MRKLDYRLVKMCVYKRKVCLSAYVVLMFARVYNACIALTCARV